MHKRIHILPQLNVAGLFDKGMRSALTWTSCHYHGEELVHSAGHGYTWCRLYCVVLFLSALYCHMEIPTESSKERQVRTAAPQEDMQCYCLHTA